MYNHLNLVFPEKYARNLILLFFWLQYPTLSEFTSLRFLFVSFLEWLEVAMTKKGNQISIFKSKGHSLSRLFSQWNKKIALQYKPNAEIIRL